MFCKRVLPLNLQYFRIECPVFIKILTDFFQYIPCNGSPIVEEEEKGEHEEFYIHFFSDAFLAALVRWLEDRECVSPQEFSALLRSSVEMIAKYVLQSQK